MQVHSLFSSPKKPHGQGFEAAIKVNLAGKRTEPAAREIVICPSSIGCLNASKTCLGNSANSSKNKTPRWASEISPGLGILPPPIKPIWLVVWCGLLNGRDWIIGVSESSKLATEYILVTSKLSSNVSFGKIVGNDLAIRVLPAPGEPFIKT